ncbi:unnamed protein product, partial [marine sediment metagenome]
MVKKSNVNLDKIYENYSLKSVKSVLAKDAKEAERAAVSIGFPVALKIESPDILHKTDIGGVELNIYSEEEVKKAYTKIMNSVKSKKPDAKIIGIIVQEMFSDCFEIILG